MSLGKKVGVAFGALLLMVLVLAGGFVGYAMLTAEARLSFPSTPLPALAASTDPALLARGRYLVFGPAHCAQCHASDDREHPEKLVPGMALAGGLEFAMGPIGVTWSANLTPDPETGIGQVSDAQLARTLRTGVMHDGTLSFFMRYSAATLADEDIVAVISYLRSQPPVKHAVARAAWGPLGKALLPMMKPTPRATSVTAAVQAGPAPTIERGAYLAENVALCTFCHTGFNMKTMELNGPKAGGGRPDPSHGKDSDMEFVTPNLTSDSTGYTGRVDEDYFVKRLKSGRAIPSSIMPWENFKELTDDDARSIYRYLRSLPPVKNDVGPTYRKRGWKPSAAKDH